MSSLPSWEAVFTCQSSESRLHRRLLGAGGIHVLQASHHPVANLLRTVDVSLGDRAVQLELVGLER
jgi:hypothetical protein